VPQPASSAIVAFSIMIGGSNLRILWSHRSTTREGDTYSECSVCCVTETSTCSSLPSASFTVTVAGIPSITSISAAADHVTYPTASGEARAVLLPLFSSASCNCWGGTTTPQLMMN